MRLVCSLLCVVGILLSLTAYAEPVEVLDGDSSRLPRIHVVSSDENRVELEFELPEFDVERFSIEDEAFQLLSIPGGALTGEVGEPSIPTFSRLVAIPDEAGVQVSVTMEEVETLSDIYLLPMQPDEGETFAYNAAAYERDGFGDARQASIGRPAIFRDMRVVPITFRPVSYNPADRSVRVARRMQVSVEFVGTDLENAKRSFRQTIPPSFDQLYRSTIVNYEGPDAAHDQSIAPGTYLVICPNNSGVTTRLQPLLEWRERKGMPVYLATTAETGSSKEQIKSFIQNAYNTWPIPPEHVVLVGDANGSYQIPTWFENQSGYWGEGDHPYTQLEGGDVLADVHLGRLSISSLNDLEIIVGKSVGYESTPHIGSDTEWYTRACLVGDPGSSGWSTVEVQRWIKTRLLDLGYTDIDTIFGGSFVTQMRNALNLGDTIFSYRGWLGMSGWSNSNTNQLTNGWEMPFCVIITCGTGNFEGGTARSEGFLRAGSSDPVEPKGGIGAIGTATSGTHTRYNNCMHYGIVRGLLWEEQYSMGAALTRGKLEMYLNYQETEPDNVIIWSYWNSLMGDSACEIWTGFPEAMTVTHDASVHVGANAFNVSLEDDQMDPIVGAQVCLSKDGETYIVGYTNSAGELELPISVPTTGDMLLTITHHDHHPYLATVPIVTSGIHVGYYDSTIDDDTIDTSSGNGDGKVNPGETIELPVQLRNYGVSEALNVTAVLSSADPYVTITDPSESFGDIPGNSTAWSTDDFDLTIDPSCPHNRTIRLGLDVTSGLDEWHSLIDLNVISANLVTDATTLYGAGGNGRLDPGETVELSVRLRNEGTAAASLTFGTLVSLSPFVTVTDATGSFGSIAIGGTGENTSDRFEISADPETFEGHSAAFNLITQFNGASNDTAFVLITVGDISTSDPVGPDGYGYYAFDNTDTGYEQAPSYSWVEIDPGYGGSGTEIVLGDYGDYQDKSRVVNLPFTFTYYGQDYTRATVCSNGWIAMDATYLTTYRNWTIPGAGGPDAMIAPFWDDLEQNGGAVYQWYDSANHRWIVEWSRLENDYNGYEETFQAILYDPAHHVTETGDGEILFQYETIRVTDPVDAYCTVGIENHDQSDGVLYTFFNRYPDGAATLTSGRAIFFTTNTGMGTVGAQTSGAAPLTYGLDPGNPNPFNPMTTITYRVPESAPVTLKLYDVAGRLVATLVDGTVQAGEHRVQWNARGGSSEELGSGIYFVRLEAPGYTNVRQLTLLK